MIDFIAVERQFAEHSRPIWAALPEELRGRFLTADDLETAERTGTPALVASHGDLRAARELGASRIAYLEHGAGQSYGGEPHRERYGNKWCPHCHPSFAGGADHEDVSLFLVPGPHPAARWREAYPEARVEVVGCAKLDTLPNGREYSATRHLLYGTGPSTVVALSFHFNAGIGSPEGDSLFRWYRNAIPALRKRFNLIGHAHPRWANRVRPWFERAHVPFVERFDEVCAIADVYAVDNSSTLFEFAATGRPVVALNGPLYRRTMNHGLRFWDAAHVGVHAKPDRLEDAVELAITDPPGAQEARSDALSRVYAHRSGGAGRAAAAIVDWLAA